MINSLMNGRFYESNISFVCHWLCQCCGWVSLKALAEPVAHFLFEQAKVLAS